MIFKNHQNKFIFNESLTLNDVKIKEVNEIKNFGVVIELVVTCKQIAKRS